MDVAKYLMIGLPETGKTTFLAALWHVVESEEVSGSLRLSEVHGIRDYLNKIRTEWLSCRQLERTTIPAEKLVSFKLHDPRTNKVIESTLPDLSGETFRLQWELRQWTSEFDKFARESSGGLLFVHPRAIIEPVKINAALDNMAAVLDGASPAQAQSATSATEPWSASHTPTATRLVEIIQFLRYRAFRDRRLPLAVVISAWDLISGQTPIVFLEKRLPLFHQFLLATRETIPFAVFGVSAQGGELSTASDLQQHTKASDRIIVTQPSDGTTHDITAPLRWLMEQ